jgi:hypothetical protein
MQMYNLESLILREEGAIIFWSNSEDIMDYPGDRVNIDVDSCPDCDIREDVLNDLIDAFSKRKHKGNIKET